MLILLGWNSRIFDGRRECDSHEIPNPAKKNTTESVSDNYFTLEKKQEPFR